MITRYATALHPFTSNRQDPPVPQQKPRDRDVVIDTAKLLAITLVVVGHALEPLISYHSVRALYIAIYAFHMPLFALISGYVIKDVSLSDRRIRRLITGVLIPYVVFESAYGIFTALLDRRSPEISLLNPYWMMWFLVALFLWRAAMPYLVRLRWPLALALLASVAVGFSENAGPTMIYRTVGLFPFFVLGYLLPSDTHHRLRTARIRIAGIVAFAVLGLVAWELAPVLKLAWVFWRTSYSEAGAVGLWGIAGRALLLSAGAVLSLALLAWTPASTRLAKLGERSMYVYLLHGFVLLVAEELRWYDHVTSPIGVIVVAVAAIALTFVLASRPTRWLFRPFVEPTMRWAFSGPAPRAGAAQIDDPRQSLDRAIDDKRHSSLNRA